VKAAMVMPGHELIKYINNLKDKTIKEQPGGVDLTIKEVYKFKSYGKLYFLERELPLTEKVEPEGGYWLLKAGAYKIVFTETVAVPKNAVGLCFPRSTLLRCGADLRCAVWDPGYYGSGEALLYIFNSYGLLIEVGARVGQLIFIKLTYKPHKLYKGAYLGENIDSHDKQYRD
jgi:dUTP pyrophosphatase